MTSYPCRLYSALGYVFVASAIDEKQAFQAKSNDKAKILLAPFSFHYIFITQKYSDDEL